VILCRDACYQIEKMDPKAVAAAADAIADADAILCTSGAGMGVDCGLGTFRGRNAGVWAPLKALGVDFSEMSCPDTFEEDPRAAWAFWRFRHQAYTKSAPHEGYRLVKSWGDAKEGGLFAVTSNIDGHWERVLGSEKVHEAHGALTHMQLLASEGSENIWRTDDASIEALQVADWDLAAGDAVEVLHQIPVTASAREESESWQPARVAADGCSLEALDGSPLTAKAVRRAGGNPAHPDLCRVSPESPLPVDASGSLLRPNVLMFGDGGFVEGRIEEQRGRLSGWLEGVGKSSKIVILEIGAGLAVPTIRWFSEQHLAELPNSTLVRVNLDDPKVPFGSGGRAISIGGEGALKALQAIDEVLATRASQCK
jgi:NAD-dependent SIR2 family protein deacetylase